MTTHRSVRAHCASVNGTAGPQRLRPLLALEPAPRPVADTERLWIVDGTLIPVRGRQVGASARPAPPRAQSDQQMGSDLPRVVRQH